MAHGLAGRSRRSQGVSPLSADRHWAVMQLLAVFGGGMSDGHTFHDGWIGGKREVRWARVERLGGESRYVVEIDR